MDSDDIRAAQLGDIQAQHLVFEYLYRHLDSALRAFGIVERRELIQKTLADAHAKLSLAPEAPAAFSEWAFSFACKEVQTAYRDCQRARARAAKLIAQWRAAGEVSGSISREVARRQRLALMNLCIGRLPPIYYEAVQNRTAGGTHAQLAKKQGVPVETARGRYHEAKLRLRDMIEDLRRTDPRYRTYRRGGVARAAREPRGKAARTLRDPRAT